MSEWISVKERLPEIAKTSVLATDGKKIWEFDGFKAGSWVRGGWTWEILFNTYGYITHWMPLPEPPPKPPCKNEIINEVIEEIRVALRDGVMDHKCCNRLTAADRKLHEALEAT